MKSWQVVATVQRRFLRGSCKSKSFESVPIVRNVRIIPTSIPTLSETVENLGNQSDRSNTISDSLANDDKLTKHSGHTNRNHQVNCTIRIDDA